MVTIVLYVNSIGSEAIREKFQYNDDVFNIKNRAEYNYAETQEQQQVNL